MVEKEALLDELLNPTPSRPEKGTTLFSNAGLWQQNAIVGGNRVNWDLFCDGYRRAADAIVDHFIERRTELSDYSSYHAFLACPIIFLYRHYLELRLKDLFIGYGELLGESTKVGGHKLTWLWQKVYERASRASTESVAEIDEDMDILEGIVQEFDRIDPKSETFRYPVDNQGSNVTLPPEIDLLRLKEAMKWVSYVLDGWSVGVDEYISAGHTELDYSGQ